MLIKYTGNVWLQFDLLELGSTSFTLPRCGRSVHLTWGGTGRLFVCM